MNKFLIPSYVYDIEVQVQAQVQASNHGIYAIIHSILKSDLYRLLAHTYIRIYTLYPSISVYLKDSQKKYIPTLLYFIIVVVVIVVVISSFIIILLILLIIITSPQFSPFSVWIPIKQSI